MIYAGLGGWTDGLLAAGYEVIGYDIRGAGTSTEFGLINVEWCETHFAAREAVP